MSPDLPEFFIRLLTKPRNLVFDPFSGSNCTGAAAESLKRRWLATEPESMYIDGSVARFPTILARTTRPDVPDTAPTDGNTFAGG